MVLTALKSSGLALEFAASELRAEPSVVLAAVQKDGLAVAFASAELKLNESLALAAVRSNTAAVRLLPKALSNSMSFLCPITITLFYNSIMLYFSLYLILSYVYTSYVFLKVQLTSIYFFLDVRSYKAS